MEIKQISDKEYFAIEAFSNSAAASLRHSPKHFKANSFDGSAATNIGSAFHGHLLNDPWDSEIEVWTETKTIGVKAKAFKELHKGKTVISQHEASVGKKIYDEQDPAFKEFFKTTRNEIAIVGEIEGIPVKCKIDAYSEKMKTIYDPKTTIGLDKFKRNFYELGYHTQAAWYLRLAELAGLEVEMFMFYVVESSAPYCHKIVTCSHDVLEDGKEDVEAAFQIYKQCYLTKDWNQGYDDDVFVLERPYWRRAKKTRGPKLGFG